MAKRIFFVSLICALGFSTTIVISLLAVQAGFTGIGATIDSLTDGGVRSAILLSLFTSTFATIFALILAIPSAYLLARRDFPGKIAVDAVLDVPMILSPVALGLSILLIFRTSPGIWVESNLMSFIFEVPGIVLAQFLLALAISIRVLKASFEDVDVRMEQVARFLGCTEWQAFRHVTLPLSKPGLIAAFVLGWGRAIGDFGATVTVAGAVKGKTETIPVSIYLNLSALEIEKSVALMLVLTFSALAVLLTLRAVSRKKI